MEPPDLWTSRLPMGMSERAPRLEYCGDQQQFMKSFIDGKPFVTEPRYRYADGSFFEPGVTARLRDLDDDGVWAETLFPNTLGLGHFVISDPVFAMQCARIWNDYLAEEYLPFGEREIAIAVIPIRDVGLAVEEIERVRSLGFRGIMLPLVPPEPYYRKVWDPIWEVAQANALPISFHGGTGYWAGDDMVFEVKRGALTIDDEERVGTATEGWWGMVRPSQQLITHFVLSGKLEQFPRMQLVIVETFIGWLACTMQVLNGALKPTLGESRRAPLEDVTIFHRSDETPENPTPPTTLHQRSAAPLPLKPSEYIRRQVHCTFMNEPAAIQNMNVTGVEPLLWGSDYPHVEGTWPNSRAATQDLCAALSDEDQQAILGGNLASLYGISIPSGD